MCICINQLSTFYFYEIVLFIAPKTKIVQYVDKTYYCTPYNFPRLNYKKLQVNHCNFPIIV